MISSSQYSDREVKELWAKLKPKISEFFQCIQMEPALLHGDLWSGNVGEDSTGPGILYIRVAKSY